MVKHMLAGLSLSFSALAAGGYQTTTQEISLGNDYQAISIAQGEIWVSGTNSSVYKSTDNGRSWQAVKIPKDKTSLQFRDIELVDGHVLVMAAGVGTESRIYHSKNQGKNWELVSYGQNAKTFYNCAAIVNKEIWLYGDSINGQFFVLNSDRRGRSWEKQTLPFAPQATEGGFAASGTCLNHDNQGNVAIGTGNTSAPRILYKAKHLAWQSINSPFPGGESAGIFSLQFDGNQLYAFGGDLKTPNNPASGYRYDLTNKQWQRLPALPLNGAIYGSAINADSVFVSNPQGVAVMRKGDNKWTQISDLDIWALQCSGYDCWGVGSNDTVMKISKK